MSEDCIEEFPIVYELLRNNLAKNWNGRNSKFWTKLWSSSRGFLVWVCTFKNCGLVDILCVTLCYWNVANVRWLVSNFSLGTMTHTNQPTCIVCLVLLNWKKQFNSHETWMEDEGMKQAPPNLSATSQTLNISRSSNFPNVYVQHWRSRCVSQQCVQTRI